METTCIEKMEFELVNGGLYRTKGNKQVRENCLFLIQKGLEKREEVLKL